MKIRIIFFISIFMIILTGCDDAKEKYSDCTKITTSAIYIKNDSDKEIDVNMLDEKYNFDKLRLDESVASILNEKKYSTNTLFGINMVMPRDSKYPIATKMDKIEKATITGTYNGMLDENFAEFKLGENIIVFGLSDNVREYFNNLQEGKKIMFTITDTNVEGDNMVISDVHYDK